MLKFDLHRKQVWIDGLAHEATELKEMVRLNEAARSERNRQ